MIKPHSVAYFLLSRCHASRIWEYFVTKNSSLLRFRCTHIIYRRVNQSTKRFGQEDCVRQCKLAQLWGYESDKCTCSFSLIPLPPLVSTGGPRPPQELLVLGAGQGHYQGEEGQSHSLPVGLLLLSQEGPTANLHSCKDSPCQRGPQRWSAQQPASWTFKVVEADLSISA